MGCLQLTYEPTLKIAHRTGELMRSHEVKVVQMWLSVDPLTSKYPHYTPYSFSGNKVIAFVELEGQEELYIMNKVGTTDKPSISFIDSNPLIYEIRDNALDKMAEVIKEKVHNKAIMKVSEGYLLASDGSTYKTKNLIEEKLINLIDGSTVTRKVYGANFGFKMNGKIVTTKGLNQVDAMMNMKKLSSILRIGNVFSMLSSDLPIFDLAIAAGTFEGTTSNNNLGLALSPLGDMSVQMKEESDKILENDFEDKLNNAIQGGVSTTQSFLGANKNIIHSSGDYQLLHLTNETIYKILDGSLTDYEVAFDDSRKHGIEAGMNGSAVLIKFEQEENKAIIIHTFISNKDEK